MAATVASGIFLTAIPVASMIAIKVKEAKEAELAHKRRLAILKFHNSLKAN
jgi:hypothetical protein